MSFCACLSGKAASYCLASILGPWTRTGAQKQHTHECQGNGRKKKTRQRTGQVTFYLLQRPRFRAFCPLLALTQWVHGGVLTLSLNMGHAMAP